MDRLQVVIAVLILVGLMTAGSFAYWSMRSREEEQARELSRRLGTLAEKPEDRLFRVMAEEAGASGPGLNAQIEMMIRQAGEDTTVNDVFSRMGLFALAGVLFLGIVTRNATAVAGLMFGGIPLLLLSRRASQRALRLSEQLPDALDLVGRSLQAGHGLSDALRMCAEEMPLPIAQEFGRVYEEHNLGRDFRECMQGLNARNPTNFDLKIFVSAVLLQRETGGNLIEILENISKTVRDRFVFGAKVKALTAEARMSAMILGSLPFFVGGFLVMVRPEYLRPLIDDRLGNFFLFYAVASLSIGFVVMLRLSKVEV